MLPDYIMPTSTDAKSGTTPPAQKQSVAGASKAEKPKDDKPKDDKPKDDKHKDDKHKDDKHKDDKHKDDKHKHDKHKHDKHKDDKHKVSVENTKHDIGQAAEDIEETAYCGLGQGDLSHTIMGGLACGFDSASAAELTEKYGSCLTTALLKQTDPDYAAENTHSPSDCMSDPSCTAHTAHPAIIPSESQKAYLGERNDFFDTILHILVAQEKENMATGLATHTQTELESEWKHRIQTVWAEFHVRQQQFPKFPIM